MAQKFVLTAQLDLQSPKNVPQVVRQIRSQLKGMDVDLKVKSSPREMAQTAKQLSSIDKEGKKAAASTHKLGKTLGSAARRFAAFSVATGTFLALARAIKGGTTEAIEFERELIRISQVTGKSVSQLKGLTKEVTSLSRSLGASSSELLNAARTLSQAGFSAEKAQKALKILAQTDLAATFDNINDTTEGSIALLRQFSAEARKAGGEIKFLEQSLDAINAVSKKFAVESSDLITVIRRTGGVFEAAGGKLNELISLFTSVRATTRESAETIAVGFRTIFTRIQRSETIDQLKELGIVLQDAKGQFVGPLEAINRLAMGLKALDPRDYRFNEIVESLGGFRQIGKVIPLIKQFTTAQDALNVAQGASGSTAKDALTAQQSLGVQIKKLRQDFAGLMRDFVDTSSFRTMTKAFFGFAESLIKIADALTPLLPMLLSLAAIKIGRGLAPSLAGFTGMKKGVGTTTRAQGGIIKMARGGMVPGSGNRDTVPAMLTPGEFVIKKSSVRKMGSRQLKAMNENRYKHGGIHLSESTFKPEAGMKARTLDEPTKRPRKGTTTRIGGAFLRTSKEASPFRRRLVTTLTDKDFKGQEAVKKGPSNIGGAGDAARTASILEALGGKKNQIIVEIISGKIPVKVAHKYEDQLRRVTAGPAKKVISEWTGGGFNKQSYNKALDMANFEQVSGNLFEAALAGSSGKWDDSRTTANAPFDYPSGLGSKVGRKLRIPGQIPTDAKRSFSPESLASLVKKARNVVLRQAASAGRGAAKQDAIKRGGGTTGAQLMGMFGEDTVKKARRTALRGGYQVTEGARGKYTVVKKAAGGSISGSDTVPALLTPGEFVVNKASAQRIGYGNLGRMNRQGYAAGGVVAHGRHAYGSAMPSAKSMGIGEMTWGGVDPIKAGMHEIEVSLQKLGVTGEHFTRITTSAREAMEKGATAGEAWTIGIKEMTENIAKSEKEVQKANKKGGAGDVAAADFKKFGDVGMVAAGTADAARGGDVKAAKMLAEIQQKEVTAITKKIRASDATIPIMQAKKKAEGIVTQRYGVLAKDLKVLDKSGNELAKAQEKAAKRAKLAEGGARVGKGAQERGDKIGRAGTKVQEIAFMGTAAALTAVQFANLSAESEKAATQTVALMGALANGVGTIMQITGPLVTSFGGMIANVTASMATKAAESAASLASAAADTVETGASGASAVADTVETVASGGAAVADVGETGATLAATAALGPFAIAVAVVGAAFVAVGVAAAAVVGYFAFLAFKSKALAESQSKQNDEMLKALGEGKGSIEDFVSGVETEARHNEQAAKHTRKAVKAGGWALTGGLAAAGGMVLGPFGALGGAAIGLALKFGGAEEKVNDYLGASKAEASIRDVQMNQLKSSAQALGELTLQAHKTRSAFEDIERDETLDPQQRAEKVAAVAGEGRAEQFRKTRAAQGRLADMGVVGQLGDEQKKKLIETGGVGGKEMTKIQQQQLNIDLASVGAGLQHFETVTKETSKSLKAIAAVEFQEKTFSELIAEGGAYVAALKASRQAVLDEARIKASQTSDASKQRQIMRDAHQTNRRNLANQKKQSAAAKTLRMRTQALNLMFAKQRQSMHRALNVIDRFDDLARGLARVEKSFNNLSAVIDGTSQDFSAIPIKGLDDLGKVGNIRNFNKDIDQLTAGMGPAGQQIGSEVKKTAEIMRKGRGVIGQKRGVVGKAGQTVEAGKILKDMGITEADVGPELFGVLKKGIMEALKTGGMIDPDEFEQIFAPLVKASKHNVDALKKIQEVQNTYINMYAANIDLLMQTMDKERELRAGMVDIQQRGAERMAEARGGSLSGRANELFRTRRAQENLRGVREGGTGRQLRAGDVSGAAKTLQKAEAERQRIRSQLNNADFAQKKKLIEQDKLAQNAANKARAELERLADQSARAADVLGEIEKLRAGREAKMGLIEKFVVGGKDERQEIVKSFAGLQRAMSTGTLQSMPVEFRKLTVGLLDQFKDVRIPGAGGLTGQQVKQQLVLGDAVRMGLVSAEMAQGLATGLPEEQRLLTELGNINRQELEAQKALLENAKSHTDFARATASNTAAILGHIKARGGAAGGPVPATAIASGGLVYRAAGGSIFQPRGTDTVPAMLTPGEFVIKKSSVDKVGTGFLHSINSGPGTVYRKFGGAIPRGGPDFTGVEGAVNIGSEGSARQMMGERLKKLGVHGFKSLSRQAGFTKSMVARTMKVISEGRYDFMNNVAAKVVADTTGWLGSWKHLFSVADSKRVGFKSDAGDDVSKLIGGLTKHSILSKKVGGGAAYRKASFKLAGLVAPQYLSQIRSIREAASVWFAKREVTRRRRVGKYVPDNMLAAAGLDRVRDIDEVEGVGARAAKRAATGMGGGFRRVPRRDHKGNVYKVKGKVQYKVVPMFGQAAQQIFGVDQEDMGTDWQKKAKKERRVSVAAFARGGSVDSVPAMLTPGEFVMSRGAVQKHGVGFMNQLNRGNVQGFNKGGVVYAQGGRHMRFEGGGGGGSTLPSEMTKGNWPISQRLDPAGEPGLYRHWEHLSYAGYRERVERARKVAGLQARGYHTHVSKTRGVTPQFQNPLGPTATRGTIGQSPILQSPLYRPEGALMPLLRWPVTNVASTRAFRQAALAEPIPQGARRERVRQKDEEDAARRKKEYAEHRKKQALLPLTKEMRDEYKKARYEDWPNLRREVGSAGVHATKDGYIWVWKNRKKNLQKAMRELQYKNRFRSEGMPSFNEQRQDRKRVGTHKQEIAYMDQLLKGSSKTEEAEAAKKSEATIQGNWEKIGRVKSAVLGVVQTATEVQKKEKANKEAQKIAEEQEKVRKEELSKVEELAGYWSQYLRNTPWRPMRLGAGSPAATRTVPGTTYTYTGSSSRARQRAVRIGDALPFSAEETLRVPIAASNQGIHALGGLYKDMDRVMKQAERDKWVKTFGDSRKKSRTTALTAIQIERRRAKRARDFAQKAEKLDVKDRPIAPIVTPEEMARADSISGLGPNARAAALEEMRQEEEATRKQKEEEKQADRRFKNLEHLRKRRRTTGRRGVRTFAQGGPVYLQSGGMFQPRGTDTVPAMLTPGEFVMRKSAVDQVGTGVLSAINAGHFADGGLVNYLSHGGDARYERYHGLTPDTMIQVKKFFEHVRGRAVTPGLDDLAREAVSEQGRRSGQRERLGIKSYIDSGAPLTLPRGVVSSMVGEGMSVKDQLILMGLPHDDRAVKDFTQSVKNNPDALKNIRSLQEYHASPEQVAKREAERKRAAEGPRIGQRTGPPIEGVDFASPTFMDHVSQIGKHFWEHMPWGEKYLETPLGRTGQKWLWEPGGKALEWIGGGFEGIGATGQSVVSAAAGAATLAGRALNNMGLPGGELETTLGKSPEEWFADAKRQWHIADDVLKGFLLADPTRYGAGLEQRAEQGIYGPDGLGSGAEQNVRKWWDIVLGGSALYRHGALKLTKIKNIKNTGQVKGWWQANKVYKQQLFGEKLTKDMINEGAMIQRSLRSAQQPKFSEIIKARFARPKTTQQLSPEEAADVAKRFKIDPHTGKKLPGADDPKLLPAPDGPNKIASLQSQIEEQRLTLSDFSKGKTLSEGDIIAQSAARDEIARLTQQMDAAHVATGERAIHGRSLGAKYLPDTEGRSSRHWLDKANEQAAEIARIERAGPERFRAEMPKEKMLEKANNRLLKYQERAAQASRAELEERELRQALDELRLAEQEIEIQGHLEGEGPVETSSAAISQRSREGRQAATAAERKALEKRIAQEEKKLANMVKQHKKGKVSQQAVDDQINKITAMKSKSPTQLKGQKQFATAAEEAAAREAWWDRQPNQASVTADIHAEAKTIKSGELEAKLKAEELKLAKMQKEGRGQTKIKAQKDLITDMNTKHNDLVFTAAKDLKRKATRQEIFDAQTAWVKEGARNKFITEDEMKNILPGADRKKVDLSAPGLTEEQKQFGTGLNFDELQKSRQSFDQRRATSAADKARAERQKEISDAFKKKQNKIEKANKLRRKEQLKKQQQIEQQQAVKTDTRVRREAEERQLIREAQDRQVFEKDFLEVHDPLEPQPLPVGYWRGTEQLQKFHKKWGPDWKAKAGLEGQTSLQPGSVMTRTTTPIEEVASLEKRLQRREGQLSDVEGIQNWLKVNKGLDTDLPATKFLRGQIDSLRSQQIKALEKVPGNTGMGPGFGGGGALRDEAEALRSQIDATSDAAEIARLERDYENLILAREGHGRSAGSKLSPDETVRALGPKESESARARARYSGLDRSAMEKLRKEKPSEWEAARNEWQNRVLIAAEEEYAALRSAWKKEGRERGFVKKSGSGRLSIPEQRKIKAAQNATMEQKIANQKTYEDAYDTFLSFTPIHPSDPANPQFMERPAGFEAFPTFGELFGRRRGWNVGNKAKEYQKRLDAYSDEVFRHQNMQGTGYKKRSFPDVSGHTGAGATKGGRVAGQHWVHEGQNLETGETETLILRWLDSNPYDEAAQVAEIVKAAEVAEVAKVEETVKAITRSSDPILGTGMLKTSPMLKISPYDVIGGKKPLVEDWFNYTSVQDPFGPTWAELGAPAKLPYSAGTVPNAWTRDVIGQLDPGRARAHLIKKIQENPHGAAETLKVTVSQLEEAFGFKAKELMPTLERIKGTEGGIPPLGGFTKTPNRAYREVLSDYRMVPGVAADPWKGPRDLDHLDPNMIMLERQLSKLRKMHKLGTVYKAAGGSIFKPRGTDTVPAMLTPGEFVIRKSAVDQIGVGNLTALNNAPGTVYRQQGGIAPELDIHLGSKMGPHRPDYMGKQDTDDWYDGYKRFTKLKQEKELFIDAQIRKKLEAELRWGEIWGDEDLSSPFWKDSQMELRKHFQKMMERNKNYKGNIVPYGHDRGDVSPMPMANGGMVSYLAGGGLADNALFKGEQEQAFLAQMKNEFGAVMGGWNNPWPWPGGDQEVSPTKIRDLGVGKPVRGFGELPEHLAGQTQAEWDKEAAQRQSQLLLRGAPIPMKIIRGEYDFGGGEALIDSGGKFFQYAAKYVPDKLQGVYHNTPNAWNRVWNDRDSHTTANFEAIVDKFWERIASLEGTVGRQFTKMDEDSVGELQKDWDRGEVGRIGGPFDQIIIPPPGPMGPDLAAGGTGLGQFEFQEWVKAREIENRAMKMAVGAITFERAENHGIGPLNQKLRAWEVPKNLDVGEEALDRMDKLMPDDGIKLGPGGGLEGLGVGPQGQIGPLPKTKEGLEKLDKMLPGQDLTPEELQDIIDRYELEKNFRDMEEKKRMMASGGLVSYLQDGGSQKPSLVTGVPHFQPGMRWSKDNIPADVMEAGKRLHKHRQKMEQAMKDWDWEGVPRGDQTPNHPKDESMSRHEYWQQELMRAAEEEAHFLYTGERTPGPRVGRALDPSGPFHSFSSQFSGGPEWFESPPILGNTTMDELQDGLDRLPGWKAGGLVSYLQGGGPPQNPNLKKMREAIKQGQGGIGGKGGLNLQGLNANMIQQMAQQIQQAMGGGGPPPIEHMPPGVDPSWLPHSTTRGVWLPPDHPDTRPLRNFTRDQQLSGGGLVSYLQPGGDVMKKARKIEEERFKSFGEQMRIGEEIGAFRDIDAKRRGPAPKSDLQRFAAWQGQGFMDLGNFVGGGFQMGWNELAAAFFSARSGLAEGAQHLPGGGLYLGDPEELKETAWLHRGVSEDLFKNLLKDPNALTKSKEKGGAFAELQKKRPMQAELMDSMWMVEAALGGKALLQGGTNIARSGMHWLKGTKAPLNAADLAKGMTGFSKARLPTRAAIPAIPAMPKGLGKPRKFASAATQTKPVPIKGPSQFAPPESPLPTLREQMAAYAAQQKNIELGKTADDIITSFGVKGVTKAEDLGIGQLKYTTRADELGRFTPHIKELGGAGSMDIRAGMDAAQQHQTLLHEMTHAADVKLMDQTRDIVSLRLKMGHSMDDIAKEMGMNRMDASNLLETPDYMSQMSMMTQDPRTLDPKRMKSMVDNWGEIAGWADHPLKHLKSSAKELGFSSVDDFLGKISEIMKGEQKAHRWIMSGNKGQSGVGTMDFLDIFQDPEQFMMEKVAHLLKTARDNPDDLLNQFKYAFGSREMMADAPFATKQMMFEAVGRNKQIIAKLNKALAEGTKLPAHEVPIRQAIRGAGAPPGSMGARFGDRFKGKPSGDAWDDAIKKSFDPKFLKKSSGPFGEGASLMDYLLPGRKPKSWRAVPGASNSGSPWPPRTSTNAQGGLISYLQRGGRAGEFYRGRQSQISRVRKIQSAKEREERARKLREENIRMAKKFHPLAQGSGTISQGDQNLLDKGWTRRAGGGWNPPGKDADLKKINKAVKQPAPLPKGGPFTPEGDDWDPKDIFDADEIKKQKQQAYKRREQERRQWRIDRNNMRAGNRPPWWQQGPAPGMQRGGNVDSIPAMLTPGEFVMSRGAVQRYGTSFMGKLNEGQLPGFNKGGPVYAENGINVQPRAGVDYAGPDMAAEFAKVGAALSEDLGTIFGTMEFHHRVTVDGQLNIGGINSEVVANAIRDALASYVVGEVKKGLENAKKYFRSGE